ncbi:hypothetical protein DOS84_01810 [Flavobacterium aquariorum]|uniref:Pycsar effector protein domain-containing protein n=1 Tax=Flavobacterium aquariorum TaxID=2217670 RepID=A0A2W7U0P7_9FLAO|nr:hypothetical protein [Flavobacterium aquariorum]PZX95324.1 hypothetical protein DOS84_01810 [Flavobacterium aquariorum]
MEKIDKSLKKLEIINQWISNCDTKSSFILTFFGVITTIIFTSNIGNEMIQSLSFSKASDIDWTSIKNFLCFIITISFFISATITLYQIYLTLIGRIDTKIYSQEKLNINSNIFFGTISAKTFKDYEIETNGEDNEKYLNDINSQIFINSNIVNEKFKYYNKSLLWSLITFGVFLIYILIK